jgi:hypothetical protein
MRRILRHHLWLILLATFVLLLILPAAFIIVSRRPPTDRGKIDDGLPSGWSADTICAGVRVPEEGFSAGAGFVLAWKETEVVVENGVRSLSRLKRKLPRPATQGRGKMI